MPLRPPAGFIRPGYDPLEVPDAPTGVSATAGDAQATVSFTAPSDVGGSAISQYTAVSTPGQLFAQGSASPLTVTGLSNGTSYTFAVWALNTYGPSPYSAASGSVTPAPPDALFFGGFDNVSYINVIQYIVIASTGNAQDFGDLSAVNSYFASCSSSTRGLTGGGLGSGQGNLIYYVTIATKGNSQSFGNLTAPRNGLTAFSSSTRGVFAGGADSGTSTQSNIIDYVTIASVGNATDFGDLTTTGSSNGGVRSIPAACSSTTRGIVAGGDMGVAGATNVIQYVTIASTGNATDFGDINAITYEFCGFSSATRGCFAGGLAAGARSNTIQYITIASAGNATDFGDLIVTTSELSGTSNSVRGVIGGGGITGNVTNVIQYVTIASTGNAADFGDLFIKSSGLSACSNAHGGLA